MALGDFLFPNVQLQLLIVRSYKSDVESAKGIPSKDYTDETAIVQLHSKDMQRLSVKEGNTIKLESANGSVIVKGIADDKTPEGIAVMPQGPWAMSLVSIPKSNSPPKLHGISVTVTRSDESITALDTLLSP